MFLEQLKCERLVALDESAVADHVREHNRGEFAMFSAGSRHKATFCTSLPELSLQGKDREATGSSSWLTASQGPTQLYLVWQLIGKRGKTGRRFSRDTSLGLIRPFLMLIEARHADLQKVSEPVPRMALSDQ